MPNTLSDIDAQITAELALIAELRTEHSALTAEGQPNFSIDGRSESWQGLVDSLAQRIDAASGRLSGLYKLYYELQNIVNPYCFKSSPGGYC